MGSVIYLLNLSTMTLLAEVEIGDGCLLISVDDNNTAIVVMDAIASIAMCTSWATSSCLPVPQYLTWWILEEIDWTGSRISPMRLQKMSISLKQSPYWQKPMRRRPGYQARTDTITI